MSCIESASFPSCRIQVPGILHNKHRPSMTLEIPHLPHCFYTRLASHRFGHVPVLPQAIDKFQGRLFHPLPKAPDQILDFLFHRDKVHPTCSMPPNIEFRSHRLLGLHFPISGIFPQILFLSFGHLILYRTFHSKGLPGSTTFICGLCPQTAFAALQPRSLAYLYFSKTNMTRPFFLKPALQDLPRRNQTNPL